MDTEAWRCLVCGKLHPASDPHVPMACKTCDVIGLGHSDDHAECRDCYLQRSADADYYSAMEDARSY